MSVFVGKSLHTEALKLTTDGLENGAYRIKSIADGLAFIGNAADIVPYELHAQTVADSATPMSHFVRWTTTDGT